MWKRDDEVRSSSDKLAELNERQASAGIEKQVGKAKNKSIGSNESANVTIGRSVVITGEVKGSCDVTIEGQVDGKIELQQHVLTIGPNGKIKAQVFGKSVIVLGEVTGNITATNKVDIRENGSVDGDISAPRVAIAEGAHFSGSVDMHEQSAAVSGNGAEKDEPAASVVAAKPFVVRAN